MIYRQWYKRYIRCTRETTTHDDRIVAEEQHEGILKGGYTGQITQLVHGQASADSTSPANATATKKEQKKTQFTQLFERESEKCGFEVRNVLPCVS